MDFYEQAADAEGGVSSQAFQVTFAAWALQTEGVFTPPGCPGACNANN